MATTGRCAASPPIARTRATRRSTSTRCPRSTSTCPAIYRNNQISQELQILYEQRRRSTACSAPIISTPTPTTIFDVRLPGGRHRADLRRRRHRDLRGLRRLHLRFHRHVQRLGRRPLHLGPAHVRHRSRQIYLGGGGSPFFGGTGIRIVDHVRLHRHRRLRGVHAARLGQLPAGRGPHDLRELFARLQGRRLRSARRLDRLPRPHRRRLQRRSRSSTSCRSIRRRSTATSSATTPRCSTGASTLRLAGFHADYNDVQVPGSVGAVINGMPTFVGVTTNAGKARFQGIEFEGNAIARPRLRHRRRPAELRLVARLSRRRLSASSSTPAASTSPTAARSRTRRNGRRAARSTMSVPVGRRQAQRRSPPCPTAAGPSSSSSAARPRPGRLCPVGREPGLALGRRPLDDRPPRPQPHRQAIHHVGLQVPAAESRTPAHFILGRTASRASARRSAPRAC